MKVLVTGGAGHIGSFVCEALLAHGHEVVCLDNLSKGLLVRIEHLRQDPRFTFYRSDIRDKEALLQAGKDAEAVVHLVASKIPRYSSALEALTLNAEGMLNVLELARRTGAKVLLGSTSDVYGKSPHLPFNEDGDLVLGSSTSRRWAYAVSKLYDEHLAFAYQDEFNVRVIILRYFGCYGPRCYIHWWGGPPGLFIDAVLNNGEVEIHGDGSQSRAFIYVEDTAEATARAVGKREAEGEIINVGTDEEIPILDFARLIHRLAGVPWPLKTRYVPYSSFSKNYQDVARRVPDLSKMERLLGFRSRFSLLQGLEKTIAWHRSLSPDLRKTYSLAP